MNMVRCAAAAEKQQGAPRTRRFLRQQRLVRQSAEHDRERPKISGKAQGVVRRVVGRLTRDKQERRAGGLDGIGKRHRVRPSQNPKYEATNRHARATGALGQVGKRQYQGGQTSEIFVVLPVHRGLLFRRL